LATRRRRAPTEEEIWAAHVSVVDGLVVGKPEIETDRARFLGRGRDVRRPLAMMVEQKLSNTVGTVLGPLFALRRRVRIRAGETVRVLAVFDPDARERELGQIVAQTAQHRRQREDRDRNDEQPAHGQEARQVSRKRDRDDFRDEISGLDPAHLIARDAKRALDGRQRGRHHLHIQDRHEHADAHHGEAGPGTGCDPILVDRRNRIFFQGRCFQLLCG